MDDAPIHTPRSICADCRSPFKQGDRLAEIKLVAGFGKHPEDGREVVYLSEWSCSELAHKDCADPKLLTEERTKVKEPVNGSIFPPLRARASDTTCVACGKRFVRGDRVEPVFIVEGIGVDPTTNAPAAVCSTDFECAHRNCRDTQLAIGRGGVIISG